MAPCRSRLGLGPKARITLFFFDLVRIDDVGDVGIFIVAFDERVVCFIFVVGFLVLDFDIDVLIGRRLAFFLVRVVVLKKVGIGSRLVVERDFLDFLLFFFLLVGVLGFLFLHILGVFGILVVGRSRLGLRVALRRYDLFRSLLTH